MRSYRTVYTIVSSWLLILYSLNVSGNTNVLQLSQDVVEYDLTPYLSLLKDDDHILGPYDVMRASFSEPDLFEPFVEDFIGLSFSDASVWLKLELKPSRIADPRQWYLEVAYPLDKIEVYRINRNDPLEIISVKAGKPLSYLEVTYRHYLLQLGEIVDPQIIFIKVVTHGAIQVPLKLATEQQLIEVSTGENFYWGGIFGLILATVITSFIIFYYTRDFLFLFYFLYISTLGWMLVIQSGFAQQYLWPEDAWLNSQVTFFLMALSSLWNAKFAVSVLSHKVKNRILNGVYQAVIYFSILTLILSTVEHVWIVPLFSITVVLVSCLLAAFSCALLWRTKSVSRAAKYFFTAFLVLAFCSSFYALRMIGWVPSYLNPEVVLLICVLLEVFLLSLALSNQVKLEKGKRESTKKKLRSENARNQEMLRKFNTLFQRSSDGVAQISLDGRFITVNPSLVRILGFESEQHFMLQIKTVQSLWCNESEATSFLHRLEFFGEVHRVEYQLCKKCKTEFWARLSAYAIKNEDGVSLHYYFFVSDVEETKLKQEWEDKYKTAESANQAKSIFLANMSHEIRTPINAIVGFADLIKHSSLTEKQILYISNIKDASETLLGIVDDILDLSKIESGKIEVEKRSFSLKSLMESIEATYYSLVDKNNIEIIFDYDDIKDAPFNGDQLKIKQILFNLIGNAIKFTQQGYIRTTVTQEHHPERGYKWIIFQVRDTGPGIEQDSFVELFKEYTQFDKDSSRHNSGVGLGLSICKRLVQAMQGEIWVESEVKVGSVFYVKLPLESSLEEKTTEVVQASHQRASLSNPIESLYASRDQSEQPIIISKNEMKSNNLEGINILVAEDYEANQLLVREIFQHHGAAVKVVENGREVIPALLEMRYDLVLMDIQMPVIDGFTATKMIRAKEEFKDVPIVALTANTMKGDRERCLEAGMNDFISKPIDVDHLIEVASHWVKRPIANTVDSVPEEELEVENEVLDGQLPDNSESDRQDVSLQELLFHIELSGLDLDYALHKLFDNEKLLMEMLLAFYSEYSNVEEHWKDRVKRSGYQVLKVQVNAIRSMSPNIGALMLEHEARKFEEALLQDVDHEKAMTTFLLCLKSVLASIEKLQSVLQLKSHIRRTLVKKPSYDFLESLKHLDRLLAQEADDIDGVIRDIMVNLVDSKYLVTVDKLAYVISCQDYAQARELVADLMHDIEG